MRFQLRQTGWPLQGGRSYVPQGQIIDSASTDAWSALVVSLGITLPPLNAQPLDQATFDTMKTAYDPLGMTRWIVTVPGADGIVR
jgi:hypothetical protein